MVDHLRQHRFLAIVGASGSGKSSVVRAGIIPALRRGEIQTNGRTSADWPVHVIIPGDEPLKALAASLTRDSESVTATKTLLADLKADGESLGLYLYRQMSDQPDGRLLLVVDQFEELFTQCHDLEARRLFVENLVTAVTSGKQGRLCLILTLRADFYAHAVQYEALRPLLETRQKIVGAMSREELRRVIEGPAEQENWQLQPGLVETILQDVSNEPGALPLLSHALQETWVRRQGREMTLAGYQAAGGVRRAIAHTADAVYASLTSDQQALARTIFLRLTELGEGVEDTRRRALLDELVSRNRQQSDIEQILDILVGKRLVTLNEERKDVAGGLIYAEVAHEALIREWPTLRQWLDQNRDGLRFHRQLTEDAREWDRIKRDEGWLYRGLRLAQTQAWAANYGDQMDDLEQLFLTTSCEAEDRERREEEAARQRELQQAQQLAETQQRELEKTQQLAAEQQQRLRAGRRAIAGLGLLLLIAIVTTIFAVRARQAAAVAAQSEAARAAEADEARQEAAERADEAETAQEEAEAQKRVAQAGELAGVAIDVLERDSELATLLALASLDSAPTRKGQEALQQVLPTVPVVHTFDHGAALANAAYDSTSQYIVTAGADGLARVWQVATGEVVGTLAGHEGIVTNAIFHPSDNSIVATAGSDGTVRIWEWATGQEKGQLQHEAAVNFLSFSPNGQYLVTAGDDGSARIWAWESAPREPMLVLADHSAAVTGAVFDATGTLVATSSRDGTAKIWRAQTGDLLKTFNNGVVLSGLEFSPDGTELATADYYNSAPVLWDVDSEAKAATLPGHTWVLQSVAYRPDGRYLVSASADATARIWDVQGEKTIAVLKGHQDTVRTAVFSPDGSQVLTAGSDGTARIWDFAAWQSKTLFCTPVSYLFSVGVVYSPDGQQVATSCPDGVVYVWDSATGQILSQLERDDNPLGWVESPTYSADGLLLASTYPDGKTVLWDVETGQEVATLNNGDYYYLYIHGAAFSPDSQRLVTIGGSHDNSIIIATVWDVATQEQVASLAGHKCWVSGVSYSKDGRFIATSDTCGVIIVWEGATGNKVREIKAGEGVVGRVAFSPNSQQIASVSTDGTSRLWDVASGEVIHVLRGHAGHVTALDFSPDGKWLATGGVDQTVRVWNVSSGDEILLLYGQQAIISAVAFSPDGQHLATASQDGQILIHTMPLTDLIKLAQASVSRELTCLERVQYLREELDCS